MKLLPENQFAHSLESIEWLGQHYGIAVSGYEEATSGIENTTLIVQGNDSKYVFRIYRQARRTNAQIHAEINFMAYLGANHIPIPTIVPNKSGNPITTFEAGSRTWQLLVMEFISGKHPKIRSATLLADIAVTQARMHQLAANYAGQTDMVRRLTELAETKFIQQIDLPAVDDKLRAFLERGAAYRLSLPDELPAGPCHLDYDEENMLCEGDTITAVLDFDDMAIAPYAVCIAYTLWHIQDEYGTDTADDYLKFYEQKRPLTDHERQFLPAAMLFRHYMITAIKVLDGEIDSAHIQSYLRVEQSLIDARSTG